MLLRSLGIATLVAAGLFSLPREDDRGRPVILMLHGRGMGDRDTAALRKLWLDGLRRGEKSLAAQPAIADRDVRLVWYADVLDPRKDVGCDYAAGDPRAKRASTDPELKSFVSLVGNVIGALTNMVSDSASASELRTLSGDASFLSDARRRCGTEQRLADALDRAHREGRPVVLVAHSLGSVIAYDYLSSRRDTGLVERLVSVGSPLGAADLRRLLIGGDSTETFAMPSGVKTWINVRNEGDALAASLSFGRDLLAIPPADEPDKHEMVGYLRGPVAAEAIVSGWCAAFTTLPPSGCAALR